MDKHDYIYRLYKMRYLKNVLSSEKFKRLYNERKKKEQLKIRNERRKKRKQILSKQIKKTTNKLDYEKMYDYVMIICFIVLGILIVFIFISAINLKF